MADLTTIEKQVLEKLFQMRGGYVLNFSDRTLGEFFRDDVGLDIYTQKYNYASGSKANRIRGLWLKADNKTVAKSILKRDDFPEDRVNAVKEIAEKMLGKKVVSKENNQKQPLRMATSVLVYRKIFLIMSKNY